MALEQHQEKSYSQDAPAVYRAARKAIEKLEGEIVKETPDQFRVEVKFKKTILGKVLGERTYLTARVNAGAGGSNLVVDAYPLDALERKLLFGARKGVTATVVSWFFAHLEHNLEVPA